MAGVLGSDRQRARKRALGDPHSHLALALALALMGCLAVACTTIKPDLTRQPVELTGPFPDDYVEVIRGWIGDELLDISTVTSLQVSVPVAGHAERWPFRKRLNGWYSRVTFKAKDSVGVSKGKLAYSVLLHESAVISYRKLLY